MDISSPRFKSFAVTAGLSFWFYVIASALHHFSIVALIIFIAVVLAITQIFSSKFLKGLDVFAVINTKIFLGAMFVFIISVYGILFKVLRIDLLRLKKQDTYWLEIEDSELNRIGKQF